MKDNENSVPPKTYNYSPRAHRPGLIFGSQIAGLSKNVNALHHQGRSRSALDEIFKVLDKDPDHPQALDLAMMVVGGIRTSQLQALEPIPPSYLLDPRLDPIVTVCTRCGKSWIGGEPLLMPGMQLFAATVMLNSGAPRAMQCYACGYIVCAECISAIMADEPLNPGPLPTVCPSCGVDALKRPAYPTGRPPQQMARRAHPVVEVLVFREGPVPPDASYLREFIERFSPDAIAAHARLVGIPLFPWPDNVEVVAQESLAEKETKGEFPTGSLVEFATSMDDQKNRLYVAKIMQPERAEKLETSLRKERSVMGWWRETIGRWLSRMRHAELDKTGERSTHDRTARTPHHQAAKSNAVADYSFVRDETGSVCGIWLRDPSVLDKPGTVEALLVMRKQDHLLSAYLNKRYRKVPNQFDHTGGCFVMFGSVRAPGEKG